jgi:alkanesulfonate monooxygenase SsuD/methylene tetrahydromethanopterin reductase-like flavin-dependent oxidoreductase (luciferase family)
LVSGRRSACGGHGTGQAAEAAIAVESAGYGALWLGGASYNHQVFRPLLDATSSLVLASGIISIWQDDPTTSAALHHSLDAAHPGRFLLGVGSSHGPLVEAGGQTYERPYSKLVDYRTVQRKSHAVDAGRGAAAAGREAAASHGGPAGP